MSTELKSIKFNILTYGLTQHVVFIAPVSSKNFYRSIGSDLEWALVDTKTNLNIREEYKNYSLIFSNRVSFAKDIPTPDLVELLKFYRMKCTVAARSLAHIDFFRDRALNFNNQYILDRYHDVVYNNVSDDDMLECFNSKLYRQDPNLCRKFLKFKLEEHHNVSIMYERMKNDFISDLNDCKTVTDMEDVYHNICLALGGFNVAPLPKI